MPTEWTDLFNGKNLDGWRMRPSDREHCWTVHDGILDNTGHGVDIISERELGDFDLHIEFNVPTDSNSGIYLRGRYEIQVLDSFGRAYDYPAENGALYNQKRPDVDATKPAGEWQTLEATIRGMQLTADLNGERIHDDVTIQGPTGGQLGDDDQSTGPLMLQGDHGPVQFRDIRVRML